MPKRAERSVPQRQDPLRRRYRDKPLEARARDRARAAADPCADAFHGFVVPDNNAGTAWRYGIHRALGGDHDAPDPGVFLCAAQAACLHSTTRMLAERLEVELIDIEVAVTAEVDVRGMLMVDASVPAGFQRVHCEIRLHMPAGFNGHALKALMATAERRSPVMQTLAGGAEVVTDWHIDHDVDIGSSNAGQENGPRDQACP